MSNIIKRGLDKISGRENFNDKVLEATYKAQKKYGFKMGTGEHATWNNEADAFKHAYMQWKLSWERGDIYAKKLGDMHEDETPNAPEGERNMDLWNNAIGREVAHEMKQKLGEDYDYLPFDKASDYASSIIADKLRKGELITHPDDKRRFENMEYERLTEADRVYSNGEFANFDEKYKATILDRYLDDAISNDWQPATIENLDKRVKSGDLIYVDDYTRADGTKINGYYRRKPVR